MKSKELQHIRYTKATNIGSGTEGEVTERYIIPTFVPQPNIKAIDVTDLSDEERETLLSLYSEYAEYCERIASTIFTFENWLSHTRGEENNTPITWRTFRTDNVEVID